MPDPSPRLAFRYGVSRAISAHARAETDQRRADIEKLLHSADTALYQASNAGRKTAWRAGAGVPVPRHAVLLAPRID
jgi:GGDEF domain-containing protein